jgi:AcrR family transcriptional regulator
MPRGCRPTRCRFPPAGDIYNEHCAHAAYEHRAHTGSPPHPHRGKRWRDWSVLSPRGVAIPGPRQQLFQATERVLVREGPGGLTGRAITREAGCATGLLYNHFGNLEDFLAEFAIERAALAARNPQALPGRAGTATVEANLTEAAVTLLGPNLPALASLMASRPSLAPRVREALDARAPGLDEIERAFTAYLAAEQALGRIAEDVDTEAFGLALVGAMHQLLQGYSGDGPDSSGRIRRVVAALAAKMAPRRTGPRSRGRSSTKASAPGD